VISDALLKHQIYERKFSFLQFLKDTPRAEWDCPQPKAFPINRASSPAAEYSFLSWCLHPIFQLLELDSFDGQLRRGKLRVQRRLLKIFFAEHWKLFHWKEICITTL